MAPSSLPPRPGDRRFSLRHPRAVRAILWLLIAYAAGPLALAVWLATLSREVAATQWVRVACVAIAGLPLAVVLHHVLAYLNTSIVIAEGQLVHRDWLRRTTEVARCRVVAITVTRAHPPFAVAPEARRSAPTSGCIHLWVEEGRGRRRINLSSLELPHDVGMELVTAIAQWADLRGPIRRGTAHSQVSEWWRKDLCPKPGPVVEADYRTAGLMRSAIALPLFALVATLMWVIAPLIAHDWWFALRLAGPWAVLVYLATTNSLRVRNERFRLDGQHLTWIDWLGRTKADLTLDQVTRMDEFAKSIPPWMFRVRFLRVEGGGQSVVLPLYLRNAEEMMAVLRRRIRACQGRIGGRSPLLTQH